MKRNNAGFSLVEILIIAAILALLGLMIVPKYIKTRHSARANICVNNLRLLTQPWRSTRSTKACRTARRSTSRPAAS
jgi:Tfp pilus assembly protein FimT